MELLFEKSIKNRRTDYLSKSDVPELTIPSKFVRTTAPILPELSETDVTRHYTALESRTFGINDGFYPLGSCTMKYNPKINDRVASMPGIANIHPLAPVSSIQGMLEALNDANKSFAQITGMDLMSFQPAAGAHGELASLMMFKKYFETKGETHRVEIIVPDSAHGTNPATVSMCGMKVINVKSNENGCIDVEELKKVITPNLAGLMMTNPNTLGIFEENIIEITKIIHDNGGLCYYDGANLNAIAGVIRPGDMGFDCIHLNLHKTFSTPHGGGGPGSGAIGCKSFLSEHLPGPQIIQKEDGTYDFKAYDTSIGQILAFYGNTGISLRALAFVMSYGKEGIPLMAKHAVLNANYLKHRLASTFDIFNQGLCMHEFIVSMAKEKEYGFTAKTMAKAILDEGMMAPTMYFPLIVPEALMIEPTETEGKEMLDHVADTYIRIYEEVSNDHSLAEQFPRTTIVKRPDEVLAARKPVLRWEEGL